MLGTPYVARVSRSASYWHPSRPFPSAWMYDRDQGGGYLAGMLVHDLDYLCALLGPPVAVCAEVRSSEPVRALPDGGELRVTADDTAALMLRLACGALAVLSISVIGAHADHFRLELFGSDGTVTGDGTLRDTRYQAGTLAVEVVATGNWGLLDVREGWDAARLRDEAAGLAALGVDRVAMVICGDDPGAAENTVRRLGEELVLPVIEEKEQG